MTIRQKHRKTNTLFKKRLTEWMMLKDLKRFSEPFYKYHGRRAYGKEFVIKKRGRRSEYAIYVKRQNKMQREDDRLVIERLNQVDKMGDFLQSYRWLIGQVRNKRCSERFDGRELGYFNG